MRILFISRVHLPRPGGVQWTTHFLALEMKRRGHAVAVWAPEPPPGDGIPARGSELGYPVTRTPSHPEGVRDVIADFQPEVLVVAVFNGQSRWDGRMLAAIGDVPTLYYLHDHSGIRLLEQAALGPRRIATYSHFLVGELARRGLRASRLPPIIERTRYATDGSRRTVLFVNPVLQKGVRVASELARARPDIPFTFVRLWKPTVEDAEALEHAVDELPNIEVRDTAVDRDLYRDARILLAPSQYPEAWGRVASEAQASGIPVLASAVGGLPEAVGEGGILVAPCAGAAAWERALAKLWDDAEAWQHHAELAQQHACRADIGSRGVGDRLLEVLDELLGSG